MQPPSVYFSNLSIKHRLPLLIGGLLLAIITASALTSYRAARESGLEAGHQRLMSLTQQLASQTEQSVPLLLGKTFTAGNQPAIRTFFQNPSPPTRASALAVLQQVAGTQDQNNLQVELWNTNASLALSNTNGLFPVQDDLAIEFKQCAAEPFRAVGQIRVVGDVIAYPAVAAVIGETGKPIGFLVHWRRVSPTSNGRAHIAQLLGSDAALYYGNREGEVWTDLEKIVPKPPGGLQSTLDLKHYSRDGHSVMGLGRAISGTPWFVVVEFPDHVFLTQANRFLRRTVLVGLILFGVGVAGAFVLSRSITRPLDSLTRAASAVTAGDYSSTVNIRQSDELGALASAFNVMVVKVSESQNELEGKVSALGKSEQRLKTVIENLNEGLIISDLNGQFLNWNRAAFEMHGLAKLEEGLLKLPEVSKLFEISELDGRVLAIEEWPLQRIIRQEQLSNLELRIRRIDSDWSRIFSYGGNIVNEGNGRLVAFLTITDITQRKRADEERRRLAMIVESSEDAIIGKALDGTITSWNKAAEKLYGYQAEEVLGQYIGILAPSELSDGIQAILERLRLGDSIDSFETERVTKDGKRFWVSLTISSIREKQGAISGWSTIARDITARKHAEEALQASEIRYRRLFESAKDGVLILDAHSGRIVDVNPYLIEVLGMSKEEILGQELWELGPFKDIVASKLAFAELQARGYIRYDNLPLTDREGTIRQVEFVSNSYVSGGSHVIQCNIRDITERKLAEEDLRQTNQSLEGALAQLQNKTQELASMSQQLWQASKLATMGELAASVAHELNNPLATISLHAENLVSQRSTDDPDRRSLLVIEQEVERMASLVSNLLLFSRRSQKQIATLDLTKEIRNLLDFIQYHLRSHNIDIVQDFPAVLPTIEADSQQLRQVFLNLITNASDAMPKGGTLTVRCRAGTMADGQRGVVVEFSDNGTGIQTGNGSGIQTGDLLKLWEPFFTTKPEGKGTGLGLSICRRTVEEHRGTIEIETETGKGTTVRITLPATAVGIEVAA